MTWHWQMEHRNMNRYWFEKAIVGLLRPTFRERHVPLAEKRKHLARLLLRWDARNTQQRATGMPRKRAVIVERVLRMVSKRPQGKSYLKDDRDALSKEIYVMKRRLDRLRNYKQNKILQEAMKVAEEQIRRKDQ